jgi:hypothetical protein
MNEYKKFALSDCYQKHFMELVTWIFGNLNGNLNKVTDFIMKLHVSAIW